MAATSDESITCATEVWTVITDSFNSVATILNELKNVMITAVQASWDALSWVAKNILLPVTMTGINILGYFFDKFLYGFPLLRPHLHDGLIESEIPQEWREFVRNNTGWDIYETMGPILDNTFGTLGLGIGVLNFLNHLTTSICKNIFNFSHVLGNHGIFGQREKIEDKRNSTVKIVFGLLSAPLVALPLFISNTFDGIGAFCKNFFDSFFKNVTRTFNLLGEYGVFGPRRTVDDKRCLPAQIIYGSLSAPFVAVVSSVTNIVDGVCAFAKNFFESFGYNVKRTFNLLGENGVMGARRTVDDKRGLPAQIIYGILSAPFVAVVSSVTNIIDVVGAFAKNFFESFGYNVARTFNLLGEDGVMGARRTVDDKRGLPAQIIYGILSAPFVAVVSSVTNIVDGVCAFAKNFFESFGYNVTRTFNLLGEDGVMGARRTVDDERGLPAQIIYGILSAPFVAVVSSVTNIVDGVCAFAKNFFESFGYNVTRTFNLLGEDGVMGARRTVDDKRGLPAQIIYGILSAPFVAVVSSVTNIVDGVCAFAKNFFESFVYNVKRTFNLLGENGVMGPRRAVDDKRGLPAQIIYGILSAPFVAVVSTVTNIVDGIGAFSKNFFKSFRYNVARTFNLLGENGVMGARRTVNDERSLPVQIIYGILSAPFVAVVSTVTNIVDGVSSFAKNFFESFGYNVKRTFNLLGENGVMGLRRTVDDKRGLPAQIIYGILSAPFVAVVSSVTNIVDGVCAFAKNFFESFGYNVKRTFNLLGENGVMGARRTVDDTRGLPAQIIYGILSAPFVAVVSSVTNIVDGACAFAKNFFESFGYNVKRTFNLLGENGVMGARRTVDDKRGLPAQIIYGILSAPFVAVVSSVTNIVDGVCAFAKNFFESFGYNVKRTFNLLGENGVMGARRTVDDTRGLSAQIIYGILSAPFVAVVSSVTNIVDGVCAFAKNFFESFGYNVKRTFNLLGENGVMGPRRTVDDTRGLPAQIIYGILSAPFVAVVSTITNIVDGVCAFAKNLGLSFVRNLSPTFNFLGKYGVMGPRLPYEDNREMPAKIVYGVLSAPFVGITAAITNSIDAVCAYFKNYEKTIKKPALLTSGIVGGVLAALPTFILRKTLKGVYNCTFRPIVDCVNGEAFSGKRMLNGIANVVTCGVFAVAKKVFKVCTGYTSRFGFPQKPDVLLVNPFDEVQNKFKRAIELASQGNFPDVKDGQGIFRSLMRTFYGMHHQVEEIIKTIHDAYLKYAHELRKQNIEKTSVEYNMNRFFQSPHYGNAKKNIQLRPGEESLIEKVESYLEPSLSFSPKSI